MKKKREVHEGIINLVHQKSFVDPRPEVIVEKLILFVLSNLAFAYNQLNIQYCKP
jgi:hypothetical protein